MSMKGNTMGSEWDAFNAVFGEGFKEDLGHANPGIVHQINRNGLVLLAVDSTDKRTGPTSAIALDPKTLRVMVCRALWSTSATERQLGVHTGNICAVDATTAAIKFGFYSTDGKLWSVIRRESEDFAATLPIVVGHVERDRDKARAHLEKIGASVVVDLCLPYRIACLLRDELRAELLAKKVDDDKAEKRVKAKESAAATKRAKAQPHESVMRFAHAIVVEMNNKRVKTLTRNVAPGHSWTKEVRFGEESVAPNFVGVYCSLRKEWLICEPLDEHYSVNTTAPVAVIDEAAIRAARSLIKKGGALPAPVSVATPPHEPEAVVEAAPSSSADDPVEPHVDVDVPAAPPAPDPIVEAVLDDSRAIIEAERLRYAKTDALAYLPASSMTRRRILDHRPEYNNLEQVLAACISELRSVRLSVNRREALERIKERLSAPFVVREPEPLEPNDCDSKPVEEVQNATEPNCVAKTTVLDDEPAPVESLEDEQRRVAREIADLYAGPFTVLIWRTEKPFEEAPAFVTIVDPRGDGEISADLVERTPKGYVSRGVYVFRHGSLHLRRRKFVLDGVRLVDLHEWTESDDVSEPERVTTAEPALGDESGGWNGDYPRAVSCPDWPNTIEYKDAPTRVHGPNAMKGASDVYLRRTGETPPIYVSRAMYRQDNVVGATTFVLDAGALVPYLEWTGRETSLRSVAEAESAPFPIAFPLYNGALKEASDAPASVYPTVAGSTVMAKYVGDTSIKTMLGEPDYVSRGIYKFDASEVLYVLERDELVPLDQWRERPGSICLEEEPKRRSSPKRIGSSEPADAPRGKSTAKKTPVKYSVKQGAKTDLPTTKTAGATLANAVERVPDENGDTWEWCEECHDEVANGEHRTYCSKH